MEISMYGVMVGVYLLVGLLWYVQYNIWMNVDYDLMFKMFSTIGTAIVTFGSIMVTILSLKIAKSMKNR